MSGEKCNIYAELPAHYVDPKVQPGGGKNSSKFTVQFIGEQLKQRADQYAKALNALEISKSTDNSASAYKDKVKDKVLSLNSKKTKRAERSQSYRERKRQRQRDRIGTAPKPLSSKQGKKLCLYSCPPSVQKYSIFEPLNGLWESYMAELLVDCKTNNDRTLSKLLKADFHGSQLSVIRSSCPNFVGISGICVRETEHLFHIIQQDNSYKKVPKAQCIFNLTVNGRNFTLYGKHFCVRPYDRIVKKFKVKPSVDL